MKIMKIITVVMIIGFIIIISAQTEPEIYYKTTLNYEKGSIEISSVEIYFSKEKIENILGIYPAGIKDDEGNTLDTVFFDLPINGIIERINPETGLIEGGEEIEILETSFEIFIPYYENAKEIVIYDEMLNEVVVKDIREFSSQKIFKKISESEQVKEDEEIIEKKDERRDAEKKGFIDSLGNYWWVFLIILIVLLLILIYQITKKTPRKRNRKKD